MDGTSDHDDFSLKREEESRYFLSCRHTSPFPHSLLCAGDSTGVLLSRAKPRGDLEKERRVRIAARQEKTNPAGIAQNHRPDFEQFESNRAAGGLSQFSPVESQPTQRLDQTIRRAREQQA